MNATWVSFLSALSANDVLGSFCFCLCCFIRSWDLGILWYLWNIFTHFSCRLYGGNIAITPVCYLVKEGGKFAFEYLFLFLICSYLFGKFIRTGVDIFARVLLQESRRRLTSTFTLVVYGQFLIRLQELWFNNKSPILRRSSLILWTKKRPFRVLFSDIITCEWLLAAGLPG